MIRITTCSMSSSELHVCDERAAASMRRADEPPIVTPTPAAMPASTERRLNNPLAMSKTLGLRSSKPCLQGG
jgi:hypothetical protein